MIIGPYTITGGPLWHIRRNGELMVTDNREVQKIIRMAESDDVLVKRLDAFWKAEF
jgi:hypothetical protein